MITPEEFLARWRDTDLLVRFDPAVVETLSISEDSKQFLITAGLPATKRYHYTPHLIHPSLSVLKEAYGDKVKLSRECEHLRVLGVYFVYEHIAGFVCLDDCNDGKIFGVSSPFGRDKELSSIFTNSSIQQYAEYLLILKECQESGEEIEAKEIAETITEEENDLWQQENLMMGEKLYELDPEACQENRAWYSVVRSLRENGFLY